jgi:hypothetical protein
MKVKMRLAAAAALSVMASASPAFAHHSFQAVFDMQSTVTLHGTVTKFDFINPHGRLYFDVKDEATGKVTNWSAEVSNPNAMLRLGWNKNTVKPGDVLTVVGAKARDGTNFILGRTFTLPDGRQLLGNSPNTSR